MINFRQKEYTIQEGHYTGPKDMEDVPSALSVIGKSTLAGTGVGAVIGTLVKDTGMMKGAATGGKVGFIAGVLMKVLLNMLHNPMTTVKYQEVDKLIRRDFGIYRVSGITVGDSRDRRGKLDEKFAFNDRNVCGYKINVSIQDNNVTLYTLGLTDQELKSTSDSLDYYCKKYFGMEYTSRVINSRDNSYSVSIVFTNYQIISNFLIELSDVLNTKINLLDNKALVDVKIAEKQFSDSSVSAFDKYDLIKIFAKSGIKSIPKFQKYGIKKGIAGLVIGSLKIAVDKLNNNERAKIIGLPVERSAFDNTYLEEALKRLRYIENIDYTVGIPGAPLCIYLDSGTFIICAGIGTKEYSKMEKLSSTLGLNRTEIEGKAGIYTYLLKSRRDFDVILQKICGSGLVPNIYEK